MKTQCMPTIEFKSFPPTLNQKVGPWVYEWHKPELTPFCHIGQSPVLQTQASRLAIWKYCHQVK